MKIDFIVNPDSKPGESPAAAADEFNFRRAFARHWRESMRYLGFWRSLRELADAGWGALLELLPSHRKARFGDLDYDWEHSVDTTRSNVGFGTQFFTGVTGRPYFATEPWLFQEIMQALAVSIQQSAVSHRTVAEAGLQDFTFIDLGCGKGRVLLMASDYPLKRIIGVEFMPELHRTAQKNISWFASGRQRCRQIETLCMDARDFQFPDGPLVVYLFNPFSEATFAQVLENLRRSVERSPRPVYVAYRFTEFEQLLTQAEWLEKIAGTEQWAVYKNRQDRA
ncbi:MAG TPA: class I SAM-dependent methyltransferase [Candidatus Angelobacter sp.]|nr:class I SAM-dependent methyltransferase [Candidatus Angelobacter sp.]